MWAASQREGSLAGFSLRRVGSSMWTASQREGSLDGFSRCVGSARQAAWALSEGTGGKPTARRCTGGRQSCSACLQPPSAQAVDAGLEPHLRREVSRGAVCQAHKPGRAALPTQSLYTTRHACTHAAASSCIRSTRPCMHRQQAVTGGWPIASGKQACGNTRVVLRGLQGGRGMAHSAMCGNGGVGFQQIWGGPARSSAEGGTAAGCPPPPPASSQWMRQWQGTPPQWRARLRVHRRGARGRCTE